MPRSVDELVCVRSPCWLTSWRVTPSTPPAIVNKLNAELAKITGNAEVRRNWAAQGTTPMTMGVDEFTRYVNDDIAKWANIVKISGAKVE